MSSPRTDKPMSERRWSLAVKLAGATGAIAGAVATWVGFGTLPIDARILIAIVTTALTLLSTAFIFDDVSRHRTGKRRRRQSIVLGLGIAVVAFVLLRLSVTYHSLIIDDECQASRPGWRCVGLRAPRQALSLKWTFAAQPATSTVKWSPGYWSDVTGEANLQVTASTLTVDITDFGYPQRYGVAFRTAPSASRVEEQVRAVVPSATTRLRSSHVNRLMTAFAVGACALWPIASWFLYSSSRWLAKLSPRTSVTQEQ
jgi:hypothetical protein